MPVVVEDIFFVDISPHRTVLWVGQSFACVQLSRERAKRKKAQLRSLVVSVSRHLVNLSVTPGNLTISVVPKIQQLVVLLRTQGLEASWVVAAEVPLTLCKMVVPSCTTPTVLITITILETLNWAQSSQLICSHSCPKSVPHFVQ